MKINFHSDEEEEKKDEEKPVPAEEEYEDTREMEHLVRKCLIL